MVPFVSHYASLRQDKETKKSPFPLLLLLICYVVREWCCIWKVTKISSQACKFLVCQTRAVRELPWCCWVTGSGKQDSRTKTDLTNYSSTVLPEGKLRCSALLSSKSEHFGIFCSNGTYLFAIVVLLAQLRVLKAKASEEFHAWKIKQEATVLRVVKHKYLEKRSVLIGSILQKQNVVGDTHTKKI